MRGVSIAICVIFLFCHNALVAGDYYVKQTSSGQVNGSDWSNAYGPEEFAAALLNALPGDVFHLAEGVYTPYYDILGNKNPVNTRNRSFYVKSGVTIKGGYDNSGNYTSDKNSASKVILSGETSSGQNKFHVVVIANTVSHPQTGLTNLTVTKGYANGGGNNSKGGGIFIGQKSNTPVILENIHVLGNQADIQGAGIHMDVDALVNISNSKIENNTRIASSDLWGGGINVWYSTLNIKNSIVSDNTSRYGAGVHVTRGKLVSENCVYRGNQAEIHGGGLDNYNYSEFILTNDSIVANKAIYGGGLHNEAQSVFTGNGLVVANNIATVNGGGFYNCGACTAKLNDCFFTNNTAENRGGGIDNHGYMDINRSRIAGNVTIGTAWGGGINQSGGRLNVRLSEISENRAKQGAGINMESGTAIVSNTTISGNTAGNRAGGVCSYAGRLTLISVTITNNITPPRCGAGILIYVRPEIINSIISGNNNEDNIIGSLNESGSGVSFNNILGTKFFEKGNKSGVEVNFDPALHMGVLEFDNRYGAKTRVHKLLWTGSSSSNPAVGKGKQQTGADTTLQYDQTLKKRGTYPSLGAYEVDLFGAETDIVYTEKETPVIFDVLLNDAIPAECTPTVTLIQNPKKGSISTSNPFTYTPNAGVLDSDTIKYRLQCVIDNKQVTDEAFVIIKIGRIFDRPDNIVDDAICMTEMPQISFLARKKYSNGDESLNGFSMSMVGDLNGDGKPEIVGLGLDEKNASLAANGRYVIIYNGQTGEIINKTDLRSLGYAESGQFKLRYEPRHNSVSHLALADLDNDGIGEIVITETGNKGRVYALKPILNSAKEITGLADMWLASVSYKSPLSENQTIFGSPIPYISDINGDGHPEVIVYNKIYDGETGILLLELEKLAHFTGWVETQNILNTRKNNSYVGRRHGVTQADDAMPIISIIDIDNDGVMEIVAGMKIYKPKITSRAGLSGNSFDVIRGPESVVLPRDNRTETYYLSDGFTVVADIDGDDKLDIIVLSMITNGYDASHYGLITVWSPENLNEVKAATIFRGYTLQGTSSIPFVGDINDKYDSPDGKKKLPEICITTGMLYIKKGGYRTGIPFHPLADNSLITGKYDVAATVSRCGHVFALTYDNSETNVYDRLKLSWVLEHNDRSACTGITMFDFDNDGAMDLAYRDEKSIRIISPKLGSNYVKVSEDETSHPAIRFRYTDNNKLNSYTGFEAPVIADVNGDGSADIISFCYETGVDRSKGYPYVFESAKESWAPCMPVWNQGMYFPLQINANLSVPRNPQSTLTKYVITRNGQTDTIRPYNGSWIQQPIVRPENYVPVLTYPDPSLEAMRIISSTTASTVVQLIIENRSTVSTVLNTPVTFYRNSIQPQNVIATFPLGADIYKNERVNLNFTLTGDHTKDVILARVMDNNGDFVADGFNDCDETNNTLYTVQIKATDDYYVMQGNEGFFDIRINDVAFCSLLPEIIESPKNGYSEITPDSLLLYRTLQNFTGKDTLKYVIKCHYDNVTVYDTAYVFLISSQTPDNIMEPDCKGAPIANWDFTLLYESAKEFPVWSPIVAGDIDRDDYVEVIAPKIDNTAPDIHFSSQLAVLSADMSEKHVISTPYFSNMSPSVAIANVDGYDNAAIFLTTSINTANPNDERLLIKYELKGGNYVEQWRKRYSENPNYDLGVPYITDFNGDGNADILVYDKVFDARTGKMLVDAGFIGTSGTTTNNFGEGGVQTNLSKAKYSPFMALGDLEDNMDGLPEIAAGNCVYKVTINNIADSLQNSFTLLRKASNVLNGPTSLADMNLNGLLEVVTAGYNDAQKQIAISVWNPRTSAGMANTTVSSTKRSTIISLADTDMDGYPELIVPANDKVVTFDFDDKASLTLKKQYSTNPDHGIISIFDFDQNRITEGVFKDREQIRIVQREGILFSETCAGETGNSYPLIIDINQDYNYRSEIVAIGGDNRNATAGTVRIYGGKYTRKAPARRVWNQFAYNPLSINEDLTVPAYPLSKAINYAGSDGIIGTANDIRPFNNYMYQNSLMDKNGMPVYPIPNAVMVADPVVTIHPTGDSVTFTVKFVNEGAIPFYKNFYASIFKNSITNTNILATDSIDAVINVGDTAVINITIKNISGFGTIDNYIIRLNNRGVDPFAQQECEYGDNDYTFTPDFTISNDTVHTIINTPVLINVLGNDVFNSCNGGPVNEISIGNTMKPKHGKAEVIFGADTLISYTPNKNFYGVDSFRYKVVECNNIEALAWVYVVVLKPQSLQYTACEKAKIVLGMETINGVEYNWYKGSTLVKANSNTYEVTKDATPVQTWFIEVKYKNTLITRYQVDLFLSAHCGEINPTSDCMINGTTLFKEDFGGNELSDPRISQTPLPVGITDYNFNTNNELGYSENNSYWLLKYNMNYNGGLGANFAEPVWQISFSDHTHPTDRDKGYMFMVDAAKEPGKFYECKLTELCGNTRLYFSVWIMNLIKSNIFHPDLDDDPDLMFELSDENDNILATYVTGAPPRDIMYKGQWRHYGFEFELPKDYQSIKLKIYNHSLGSSGNDFVMDDIEIKLCVPPAGVGITGVSEVCMGENLSFNGTYTDDGAYGTNLEYKWMFKHPDSTKWEILKQDVATNPVNTSFTVNTITKQQEGYYKMAVANSSTIDYDNCCAASDPVYIKVNECAGAVNDTVSVAYNNSVKINVLDNDIVTICSPGNITIDTIANTGLHFGNAVIDPADNSITYTPKPGTFGVDSVDYVFRCGAVSRTARIYIVVMKPFSDSYLACESAVATLKMHTVDGVEYNWYNAANSLILGKSDSVDITKNSLPVQGIFVKSIYKGTLLNNECRVNLLLNENCGVLNPTGCALDGRLLFKEDFGGNDPGDPFVKTNGISQVKGYNYTTSPPSIAGQYSIRKRVGTSATDWYQYNDHTYPDSLTKGYLAQFYAENAGQFYEYQIDKLCTGSNLYFSAWVACVAKMTPSHLVFILEDMKGNELVTYYTGEIQSDSVWSQYGFNYTVSTDTVLKLKIINTNGNNENIFAIDDIEVRLCVPPVSVLPGDTILCSGENLVLTANYTDDGSFGDTLAYQWLYKADITKQWSIVVEKTGSNPLSATLNIDNIAKYKEGYYQLRVGNATTINQTNCYAVSDSVYIGAYNRYPPQDVRIQMCIKPERTISLSSYIDAEGIDLVGWSKSSPLAPDIIQGTEKTTADINSSDFPLGTYSYYFKVKDSCNSYHGRLYITTLTDKILGSPDTLIICQVLESAGHLNLNQFAGFAIDGNWIYDNTINHDNTVGNNVSIASYPAINAGAYLFNATKAWEEAGSEYLLPGGYNGDMNAKLFRFQYYNPSGCLENNRKDFVIIVTEKIIN